MLSAGDLPAASIVNGSLADGLHMNGSTSSLAGPGKAGSDHTSASAKIQHIWVVTGPAGSGKSTVGEFVHTHLGLPFLEGDDYHPKHNKEKMSNGIPLTDEDRWDWLAMIRDGAVKALSPSQSNNGVAPDGVVVACSALKRKYRDVVRVAAYGAPHVRIHFIYLKLGEAALCRRLSERQAHYMKSGMIHSQLQVLEEPADDEWDALTVDADATPDVVDHRVQTVIEEELQQYQ